MLNRDARDGRRSRMPLIRLLAAAAALSFVMTPGFTCAISREKKPETIGDVIENVGDDLSDAWDDLRDIFRD